MPCAKDLKLRPKNHPQKLTYFFPTGETKKNSNRRYEKQIFTPEINTGDQDEET